ncbi:hypothetical protein QCM77_44750 [Bradyrhizobium sp. SSUT18]|uniref:hypothetical protein n=1 Tax=Bradyrhizobium sp. SSUT18 TaxID=3040602 RepID=UPI00244AB394|nr:hypothetical protein [Bradyrhizobium sp. SSUT18]MDH2406891.1 hypothetical protein [Bradyrhizobium sp. SSUT18]
MFIGWPFLTTFDGEYRLSVAPTSERARHALPQAYLEEPVVSLDNVVQVLSIPSNAK